MPSYIHAPLAYIDNQWQENVVIGVDDSGVITDIGVDGNLGSNAAVSSVEHCQGALIPGIPNSHSHAFQRIFAGLTERQTTNDGGNTDNFWSWREQMYRYAHQITPEQQRIIAQALYIDMLKAGYTSVGEFHYLHHQKDGKPYDNIAETSLSIIEAAQSTGIRLVHLPVYYGRAGFSGEKIESLQRPFYNTLERYLLILDALQKQTRENAQVSIGLAIHSLRAANEEDIRNLLSETNKSMPNAVVHLHIAEQEKEVQDCLKVYRKRPVQWLLDNFKVNNNWSLVHATHINGQERSSIIKSGASVGLCPTTEANLGDGIFPISDYLKEGGSFSVGTDSQITIDPFEEMKWLEYPQRLLQKKRVILTDGNESVGETLYKQCTQGGAQALGVDCGVIAVGKKADFIVLDTELGSSFAREARDLLDIAIFVEGKNMVKDVMVGGTWVVRDRHHRLEDKAELDLKHLASQLI